MQQKLTVRHMVNEEGLPAGGMTEGIGISIRWQDGPMKEAGGPASMMPGPVGMGPWGMEPEKHGHNGAFVEGVLLAAQKRLEFYQGSRFACAENALAIEHIQKALEALESRTKRRQEQGVEGTHQGS